MGHYLEIIGVPIVEFSYTIREGCQRIPFLSQYCFFCHLHNQLNFFITRRNLGDKQLVYKLCYQAKMHRLSLSPSGTNRDKENKSLLQFDIAEYFVLRLKKDKYLKSCIQIRRRTVSWKSAHVGSYFHSNFCSFSCQHVWKHWGLVSKDANLTGYWRAHWARKKVTLGYFRKTSIRKSSKENLHKNKTDFLEGIYSHCWTANGERIIWK